MSRECVISLVLSHHRKIWCDGWTSVITQCEGRPIQKTRREEKPMVKFWLLFLYAFYPPLEPALCKLGWPGGLFVLPEVLTLVLGPSFVLFLRVFIFLIFSHRHSGLFFSYPNYLTQVWEHVMNSVLGEDHFIWSAYYIFIICNIIMVRRYPSSKVRSSSCTLLE